MKLFLCLAKEYNYHAALDFFDRPHAERLMPKLTTNCNTGQIHLLLRHRLYRGWYSCGLVRLLLFGLIHIPDSFRKIQKWLFRQIICRRNWYFYQSLLQSEHTVIVSIHDNSIPTATVLAFMPANASIAQAGIFVSLELINGIVHQRIIEYTERHQ